MNMSRNAVDVEIAKYWESLDGPGSKTPSNPTLHMWISNEVPVDLFVTVKIDQPWALVDDHIGIYRTIPEVWNHSEVGDIFLDTHNLDQVCALRRD